MNNSLTERDRRTIGIFASTLVSIVMIIIYILRQLSGAVGDGVYRTSRAMTPLAQDIITFERNFPTLSIYLLGLTLLSAVIFLLYFATRRTLFPQGLFVQPIIFTALLISICSMSPNPLITAVTLLLLLCSLSEFFSTNHTSYTQSIYSDSPVSLKNPGSRLFIGSMYMGVLMLIHPSAAIFLFLIPFVIFAFDRLIYEIFLPIIGLFAPMCVELYLRWWLHDANVEGMLSRYKSLVLPESGFFTSWGDYTDLLQLNYPVTFLVIISLVLSGLGLARIIQYSITARAHQRLIFSAQLIALSLVIITTLNLSIEMLLIMAAPATILITASIINMRLWISYTIYAIYIALAFIAMI